MADRMTWKPLRIRLQAVGKERHDVHLCPHLVEAFNVLLPLILLIVLNTLSVATFFGFCFRPIRLPLNNLNLWTPKSGGTRLTLCLESGKTFTGELDEFKRCVEVILAHRRFVRQWLCDSFADRQYSQGPGKGIC